MDLKIFIMNKDSIQSLERCLLLCNKLALEATSSGPGYNSEMLKLLFNRLKETWPPFLRSAPLV